MALWCLDDIPWESFVPAKVDERLLCVVKAAAMVEANAADYVRYLCNVFADDEAFKETARRWGEEETQHGAALGRWAERADPTFDFEAAFKRFVAGFRPDLTAQASIRGSRAGELVARCIVETGTSSFYSALGEASVEPVLKFICRKIAADEYRHYKLFHDGLQRYLARDGVGRWARLKVALGRVVETDDDELAYAYYAANGGSEPYERARWNRAYIGNAYPLYRRHHIQNATSMLLRAVGFSPDGWLSRVAGAVAWGLLRRRAQALAT